MQINVTDLMTQPPLVVREDANIGDAVKLLLSDCAPQLDVVDAQGQLLGSVPDYELLKAQMAGEGHHSVTRVMSGSASRIDAEATADFAAGVFRDARYCRLPVVQDGRVIGQIDRRDVMRLLHTVSTLGPEVQTEAKPEPTESAIRGPRFARKQRRVHGAMRNH
ncbi:MAG: CBS domain-containing protein [Planctomycetaceae bacterium]|jgi:predicted transcriptional regulator|nr:CBS domain-containing protein [Planctomycetaceae bacterium]MBT6156807.1 CBS domain-containing protein [Planctomycetaceae bacterium]MBT6487762.1 CBS domain-containing protein [Planctomycetaceae bacterium]MBT6496591.1 CBS domain-containing protein [Planctomycetaceae bacterium]